MNEKKSRKSAHLSEEQKKHLLFLLQKHENLRKGKFSPTFTPGEAQRQWQEIALTLNALPGPHKSWKQWRGTWNDMKKMMKKKRKSLVVKRVLMGSGGKVQMWSKTKQEVQVGVIENSNLLEVDNIEIKQESDSLMNEETDPGGKDDILHKKLILKEEYYVKKLELLERSIGAQERIAAALEKLVNKENDF